MTVVLDDIDGMKTTTASVRQQTESSYEWIVVDGGSTDGTLEFVEKESESIAAWRSGRDAGTYDAMNLGVSMASGEYVLFLNAGDSLSGPDTLKKVTDRLSQQNHPDVMFGGAVLALASGLRIYRPPKAMVSVIWHGLPANHQATYYKRQLLLETPFDLRYGICGDYFIAAKVFKRGVRAAYLDEALVKFPVRGISFQQPWRCCTEAYRIQRDVLGKRWWVRGLSLARRVLAISATAVLSRGCAASLYSAMRVNRPGFPGGSIP